MNTDNTQLLVRLDEVYKTAMASGDFKGDTKCIEKAIKALDVDPEARFKRQFREIAIRNLLAKAAKTAKGGDIPYPAEEAISSELQRLLDNRRAKKGI